MEAVFFDQIGRICKCFGRVSPKKLLNFVMLLNLSNLSIAGWDPDGNRQGFLFRCHFLYIVGRYSSLNMWSPIFSFLYIVSVSIPLSNLYQEKKRYEKEICSVDYTISGDAVGSAKLLFAEYGWKEKNSFSMTYELYGIKSTQNKLDLRVDDTIYLIDFDTRKGRIKSDEITSQLLNYKSTRETQESLFSRNGGELTSEKSHLDKTVNVWIYKTGVILELWEWEGIVLYEKKKLGKVIYEKIATKIDLNPEIDPEYDFKKPQSVEYD